MRVEYREESCRTALNRVRGLMFEWSLNRYATNTQSTYRLPSGPFGLTLSVIHSPAYSPRVHVDADG